MFIPLIIATAAAQTPNYKPQVVDPPADAAAGRVTLPSDPKPVPLPQQPPLKEGEEPPKYGQTPEAPLQNFLNKMFGRGEYYNGPAGAGGEYFGPGVMERCEQAPASATKAFQEAMAFRQACAYAQRGDQQKVAINDYSSRPSYMYIFDQAGKCLGKTMVAFGNGAGGAQVACADNGSHLSPPGFHLTAIHPNGGRYHAGNSMKLVGLQGQNSVARGILLHASRAPGTSSTWGCAGVGYGALGAVMKSLGYGALVYNYWDPQQIAQGCRNRSGMDNKRECRPDAGTPGIPQHATGDGAPAVTWSISMGELAFADSFPKRERLKKGTEITIHRYLERSDTYEITMTKEEAVGPNVATPAALMKAIGLKGPVKDFKKRLERDSGGVYTLKSDLPLLWEEEIYQLQQRRK